MVYEPEKKSRIGYVKILKNESDSFLEKLKFWFKYTACIINIKKAANNVIYEIPIYKEKVLLKKKYKKINLIINKLNSEIQKENVEAIVLSSEVKELLNQLNNDGIDSDFNIPVLNGKFLMKNLLIDIIEKISKQQNQDISFAKAYVLVEKYNKENLDIIYALSAKVKNINIVTSNIRNFRKLEEKLFCNNGLAISVANNRKKGMRRADLVINFDFDSETIKKYNINRDAIIVNCTNSILNLQTGFSGIIINGIKIANDVQVLEYFKIHELLENFDITELYESLIFNKYYDKITQQKNKDKIIIKDFVGSRGIINIKELENRQRKKVSSI